MRCFLAIELPSEIRDQLAMLQARCESLGRTVRWTRPEQIHLTLKFLGDVSDRQAPALCEAAMTTAAKFAPIEIEVRGTGCFPPHGRPRVLWAGVVGPPEPLVQCQQEIDLAYAELGFEPEQRAFRPHLTIGRVREGAAGNIRAVVKEQQEFAAGKFTADQLVLFQSVLRPEGPTYTVMTRAPLVGGPS